MVDSAYKLCINRVDPRIVQVYWTNPKHSPKKGYVESMFFSRRSVSEVVLHECSMALALPQYYVYNRTIVENLAAVQKACPDNSSNESLGIEGR